MKVQLKKCTLDLNSLLLFNNKLNDIKVYLINVHYIYIYYPLPVRYLYFLLIILSSLEKRTGPFEPEKPFILKRRINRRPLFPINYFLCFLQCPPFLLILIPSPFGFSLLQHSFKFHFVP